MAKEIQIVRVLALLDALGSAKRGVALRELAERRGWSLRSVYRDLGHLQAAGFAIVEDDHRYRLVDGARTLRPPAVDRDEVLALWMAREQAKSWRSTRLGVALERLWNKVSATGGQPALLPTGEASLVVRPPSAVDYGAHRQTIATLEGAIAEHRPIRCRYRALSTAVVTERVVEPGHLHWDPRLETLYFIGWCRLRDDLRVFAVHRLRDVSLTDESIIPRAELRSRRSLDTAFRIWRRAHVERVRIRFAPGLAEEIRERRWHASQKIREQPDGGLVLELEVASPAELARWLMGFGAGVQVLEPTALAADLRARLTAAVAPRRAPALPARRPELARARPRAKGR